MIVNSYLNTSLEPFEKYGLMIAGLMHDVDHRGLNNDYQKKVYIASFNPRNAGKDSTGVVLFDEHDGAASCSI